MKIKLSELRQIIREEILKESYHEVEYYAKYGEHGSIGNWPDMNTAFKKAIDLYKREKKDGELGEDKTQYIGVSGDTDEFAIIYVHPSYFRRIDKNDFGDVSAYNSWIKVAKKVAQTGKPMKGVY